MFGSLVGNPIASGRFGSLARSPEQPAHVSDNETMVGPRKTKTRKGWDTAWSHSFGMRRGELPRRKNGERPGRRVDAKSIQRTKVSLQPISLPFQLYHVVPVAGSDAPLFTTAWQ